VTSDDLRQHVLDAIEASGADYETMECDPDLADTAAFCDHYDIPLDRSANAIVLASKRPSNVYAVFLVLATTRLDVNGKARKLMDVRKVSFAHPDVTVEETGMAMGGVTPFGLPDHLPVYVDAAVVDQPWVIVGGGTRDLKLKVDPEIFTTMDGMMIVTDLAIRSDGL